MRRILGRNGRNGRGGSVRAFTIIEVIVIVVILGILSAVIVPRVIGRVAQSKSSVAKAGVSTISTAFTSYIVDCGKPDSGVSLMVLMENPTNSTSWQGPYLNNVDDLKDPWGREYVLVIPSQNGNADFDIISYGADGQPGGEAENADIISGKK